MDHDQKRATGAPKEEPDSESREELICNTCHSEGIKSTFKTKRTLCFHLNKQGHTSSVVPECELCGQAFQSTLKLEQHTCPLQPGVIPIEPGYFGKALPHNIFRKDIPSSGKYPMNVTSLNDMLAQSARSFQSVKERMVSGYEPFSLNHQREIAREKQQVYPTYHLFSNNWPQVTAQAKERAQSTLSLEYSQILLSEVTANRDSETHSLRDILDSVLICHEQDQAGKQIRNNPDGLSMMGSQSRSTIARKSTVQLSTSNPMRASGVPRLKLASTFTNVQAISHNTLSSSHHQWLLQQLVNTQHDATAMSTDWQGSNTANKSFPTRSIFNPNTNFQEVSQLAARKSPQSQLSTASSMAPLPRFVDFETTPPRNSSSPKCNIVALDCEMVKVSTGVSELVRLSVVDASTGQTLIDALVVPEGDVANWLTNISGVSAETLADAVASGTALSGWRAARAELWKYVDASTVIVGHALQNDFTVLRLTHFSFWDSAIITKSAVGGTRNWGLKQLCHELIGYNVQSEGLPHDSVQDAHAAIQLVSWLMTHPQELELWAMGKRMEMLEDEQRRSAERKTRRPGSNDTIMGSVAS